MGSFQILDHTGEVGILAHGESLAEAFSQIAEGMYSLMVGLETIQERETRSVEVEAADSCALMVAWLNELVYLFDRDGMLFRRFQVNEISSRHIKADCYGQRLSPERHQVRLAVKAATYHMADVHEDNGWWARVILDI